MSGFDLYGNPGLLKSISKASKPPAGYKPMKHSKHGGYVSADGKKSWYPSSDHAKRDMEHHESQRYHHIDQSTSSSGTRKNAHANRADHHDKMHVQAMDFHKESEASGAAIKHGEIVEFRPEVHGDFHVEKFSDGHGAFAAEGKLEGGISYTLVAHREGLTVITTDKDDDMEGVYTLQGHPALGHPGGLDSLEGHEIIEDIQNQLKNNPDMKMLHSKKFESQW